MTKVSHNSRPTYYTTPFRTTTGRLIPTRFNIIEYRDGDTHLVCSMSNGGDRLNNLLKRGIPEDEARKLFYEMDSK